MRRSSRAPRPPTTQIRQPRGHLGVQQTPRAHKSQLNRESGAGCRELPAPASFQDSFADPRQDCPPRASHRPWWRLGPPPDTRAQPDICIRCATRTSGSAGCLLVADDPQGPPDRAIALATREASAWMIAPRPSGRQRWSGLGSAAPTRPLKQCDPSALRRRGTPIPLTAPARLLCSATGSEGVLGGGGQPRPAGVLPHCEDPTVRAGAVRRRPTRQREHPRGARSQSQAKHQRWRRRQLALPFGRRRKRAPARRRRDPDERLPRKRSSGDSTGAAERLFYGWRLLAVGGERPA